MNINGYVKYEFDMGIDVRVMRNTKCLCEAELEIRCKHNIPDFFLILGIYLCTRNIFIIVCHIVAGYLRY